MWRIFPAIPLGGEIACKFIEIKRDPVRLVGQGSRLDEARIERQPPHQRKFARIVEPSERCSCKGYRTRRSLVGEVRDNLSRVAEDGSATRMTVLDIEDRVVARLLDHFGKVKIEHRVVLAVQHHEADRVLADLINDFTQRYELPCPL